ncbi:hypothetical protein [Oceanivirga miroungae]|uniref:Uncharacterized protein n=1 Tax=Oceanivirga miroungae TaxID=1130046 RepID=A0A6I8MCH1_9FUSO|nr:hypothetical protein [Oceanivirga miroungae]VWL85129.1 hypothetical protein OMES3154_00411 [Oceanivirga miroungae]
MIFFLWLYYGKLFILGSIIATYLLNRLTKRLYYAPLIINMVSVIMLMFIEKKDMMYAIYFNYLPIVITSIIMNLIVYIYRKIKR